MNYDDKNGFNNRLILSAASIIGAILVCFNLTTIEKVKYQIDQLKLRYN